MSPKKERQKPLRRGLGLELAVARIQMALAPGSKVTHNEQIVDRLGNRRQCDVVVRGEFAGHPTLAIIECKDHGRRVGPDTVEAFGRKAEHLRANIRAIVSPRGFTAQALKLALHENIGCLSTLHGDASGTPLRIGEPWYGLVRDWSDVELAALFVEEAPDLSGTRLSDWRWQGKEVASWFYREFVRRYDDPPLGRYAIELVFHSHQWVQFGEILRQVSALQCSATYIVRRKRHWINWTGDALYDWHTASVRVPPGVPVTSSSVSANLDEWPDFDGEVPPDGRHEGFGVLPTLWHSKPRWHPSQDAGVPEMASLGDVSTYAVTV